LIKSKIIKRSDNKMDLIYSCSICESKPCIKGGNNFPKQCPTVLQSKIAIESKDIYIENKIINNIMKISDTLPRNEIKEYRSRFDEIILFIKEMRINKLGVAFCTGLSDEAGKFIELFKNEEIKIIPVCCRVGAVDKNEIGIKKSDHFISTCNPITQAEILNSEKTDLNIVIGLCVGHDVIFNKYIKGLTTTLIVKDRKYNNCPVKALND
jgi:uncharacterized metal-binding protein